jgi:signal transduction histidine kinase
LVSIGIVLKDKTLTVLISDDGSGIPKNVELHNGLHNMRERAETLGGSMEITSEKNQGTTIKWSIPCSGWCA